MALNDVSMQYSNVELLYDDITAMCTNIGKVSAPESDLYKVCDEGQGM